MKFIIDVDETVFNNFCMNSSTNHYMKLSNYGKFKKLYGADYKLLGVEENEKLVGSALLLIMKIPYLLSNYAYIPYGFNLDLGRLDVLEFFNRNLLSYLSKQNIVFLRQDPNYPRIEHTKDGKIKVDGYNNEKITQTFIKNGYRHLGYNHGYSGNWLNRFTYVIDLSPAMNVVQKNIKNYSTQHRKNVQRSIVVQETGVKGISTLIEGELKLAKELNFPPKPKKYFENLVMCFAEYTRIFEAETNFAVAKENLQHECYEIKRKMDELLLNGSEKKFHETEKSLEKVKEEISEIEKLMNDYPGQTKLGAKLIVQVGPKVFNVNMFTFKFLSNFRTAFALHDFAIIQSKTNDAKTYDFEGISGSLDKDDSYYGLHEFKRSFGGDFIEYLGEFDAIFKPYRYRLFCYINPRLRRLKRILKNAQIRRKA